MIPIAPEVVAPPLIVVAVVPLLMNQVPAPWVTQFPAGTLGVPGPAAFVAPPLNPDARNVFPVMIVPPVDSEHFVAIR